MYDAKQTIEAFLTATAAKQPAPGGGSVSALAGALAAAMGEMVINYSVGKKDLAAFEAELRPALGEFHRARELLLGLMVEDQAAYEAMTAVRKLPKGSKEREDKFDVTLLACIRVPEAIAATCLGVLAVADHMVNFVNYHLLSDLAVCADLAMASTRCAIYNVRVNLADVTEPADRRRIESTIGQMLSRAAGLVQRVSPRIWERHGQGV